MESNITSFQLEKRYKTTKAIFGAETAASNGPCRDSVLMVRYGWLWSRGLADETNQCVNDVDLTEDEQM
jgi:hypothetical protein